ncbi:tRNA (guanosine(46)-N7)-methyltransferase TrmB [Thermodesulforhabdus norvegica]|uniref:tRNA (guanine-N(7)-)-methyltransferase n=1 Tax=Thermodesulforhabdus norvegica TaxID=39841 RepID=A0A1I4VDK1_9BACT|nr:tRNA (guanosine(46)-N7)-methyltransferase TrmB [Thermodesulforhabdus norvegica]SFM99277.1 tRNA (guanine-N7-)-methyltransferase [Thermodesulforhabdus norvegica]
MKARYISLGPLIDWRRVNRPIDWNEVFRNDDPVVLEIGFGNGEYLIRRAKTEANKNFVGIEKEWQSVWRALRRIAQNQLSNVRLLKADARWAVHHLMGTGVFSEIYSLFPCPWPKERHVSRRLFSNRCLKRLNNSLVGGGVLWIVTDDDVYANWIKEQSEGSGFQVLHEFIPPSFGTKYETKWVNEGLRQFHKITLIKKQDSLFMPEGEIIVRTYRVSEFYPNDFYPDPVRGNVVVDFKDFLYDSNRGKALLRAVVVEDEFVQDFWIEISRSRDGRWHIKPASGCGWIPTVGLQKALDAVYAYCTKRSEQTGAAKQS